jgi:hypothetical protein
MTDSVAAEPSFALVQEGTTRHQGIRYVLLADRVVGELRSPVLIERADSGAIPWTVPAVGRLASPVCQGEVRHLRYPVI